MVLINAGDKQSFDDQLLRYMRERNTDKVKEILENYEPGNLIDSTQSTLLHYAAKYGTQNLVRYLVKAGCNVNAQNERGKTPLILAIEESHEYTVEDLLYCDANLYVTDNEGKSALQLACNTKICRSAKIVEMCVARVGKEYGNDNEKIVKTLIEGNCPLYFAIHVNNSAVTKILIDRGLSINSRDPTTGETALHVAVKLADVENVKILVECGSDVNARDRTGKLLFLGSQSYRFSHTNEGLEVFKILLDGGLLITAEIMHRVALLDNKQFVELVFDYDIDFMAEEGRGTILHFLADTRSSVDYDKLKGKKLDVRARDKDGDTALQMAFRHDNEKLVDFLLDSGAKIDYPNKDLVRYLTSAEEIIRIGQEGRVIREFKNCKFVKVLMKYDEGIDFVLKNQMKIFEQCLKKKNIMTPIALALLAMLDSLKTPISDNILNIVENNVKLTKHYEKCKKELAVMKHTSVYESITLLELLTENKKKIEPYMRNEKLVEKYTEVARNFDSNSYYAQVLKKRVEKLIRIAELRKVALFTFCEVVGVNMDAGCIITENMFLYLDEIDLKNLAESQF